MSLQSLTWTRCLPILWFGPGFSKGFRLKQGKSLGIDKQMGFPFDTLGFLLGLKLLSLQLLHDVVHSPPPAAHTNTTISNLVSTTLELRFARS